MANDEIVREVIVGSPLARLLGLALEHAERDRVRVRLPFRPEVTTVGDLVHGGAIAGLVDVSATAAAWSGADLAQQQRGTTVGFAISFLAAARGHDLLATARILRRGGSLCVVEVVVEDAGGAAVAQALVTYKLG